MEDAQPQDQGTADGATGARGDAAGPAPGGGGMAQRSGPSKWARRILLYIGSPIVVLVLLLAMVWLLAAPRGELRLALDQRFQPGSDDTKLAFSLFRAADSAVTSAQHLHERVSLLSSGAHQLLAMPPTAGPGTMGLGNFLTSFVINSKIQGEAGEVAVSVDGVAILQQLYGLTPWHDYFIAITEIDPDWPCPEMLTGPCYRVWASFSPSPLRTEHFEGNLESIGADLGLLVVRGIASRDGAEWDAATHGDTSKPPFLFESEMPSRTRPLQDTATGIRILMDGPSLSVCTDTDTCLAKAKAALLASTDVNSGGAESNPVAALGLALIETAEALDDAVALQPESVIEPKLQRAASLMTQAKRDSRYLRGQLGADNIPVDRLGALRGNLSGLVLNDDFYERMNQFICALEAYRRADWKGCLAHIGALTDYPWQLRPYLEGASYYSQLRNADTPTLRASTIAKIRERIAELRRDGSLSDAQRKLQVGALERVIVLDSCVNPDGVSEQDFNAAADDYIDSTRTIEAYTVAKIESAGCIPPMETAGPEVDATLLDHFDSIADPESRRRVEFAAAKYYARTGKFDDALSLLKDAMALPYLGAYVSAAPEFRALLSDQHRKDAFRQAYLAILPTLDKRICPLVN